MRVAIIYPPVSRDNKVPLLGQNRQFKYTHSREIKIFPLIPAQLAANLKQKGHEVLWLDAINKKIDDFQLSLADFKPGLVVMETKAPVVKKHWEFINKRKRQIAGCKFVMVGDHVSFFPDESLQNSKVDYVAAGGDYDITVTKLVEHLEGKGGMPEGICYKVKTKNLKLKVNKKNRKQNREVECSGAPKLYDNLDTLPFIDREITNWKIYGEAYLYRPCAYILSGRGCGREGKETGGVCTFCVWQHAFWQKKARLRLAANVAEEIKMLIEKYGVYEVFDDNESGGIWSGEWLENFLVEIEKKGIKGKFRISSNARAEDLTEKKCSIMKKAGYRLLKVGLESASNETLKKTGKFEDIETIKENIKRAKRYGFRILMTMMVGYPWEAAADAENTFKTAKELMLYKTHFGDSLQASIVMPYPGTPLYKQAQKNGQLTEAGYDYEKMDMEHDILKSDIDTAYWCRKIWNIHKHPLFLLKSALSIRNMRDLGLAARGIKSLLGHTRDY